MATLKRKTDNTKSGQKRKPRKRQIHNVQPLRTTADIKKVKDTFKKGKYGRRNAMIFSIGINTGLRCSDIVQLKVGTVTESKTPYIYEQKTGKKRQVNLINISRELNNYIKYMQFDSPDDYLFPSRTHNISPFISVDGFYRAMRQVEFLLGRSDLGTHTMRKTFGYHFYKQTKSIESVRMALNHSKSATTRRYIGITQEELNDQLKSFKL